MIHFLKINDTSTPFPTEQKCTVIVTALPYIAAVTVTRSVGRLQVTSRFDELRAGELD